MTFGSRVNDSHRLMSVIKTTDLSNETRHAPVKVQKHLLVNGSFMFERFLMAAD